MKPALRPSRQRLPRQNGQALVLTIAFSAVISIMVFFIFSSAQLVNQKSKLQNTADAAAYSAGVLQARDYNFSAYTNRAMVANHVAVAQFVGLESWTEEVQKEFQDDSCLIIPYGSKCWFWHMASLGSALWDMPSKAAAKLANAARNEFNKEKVVAKFLPPLLLALRDAQVAYHDAALLQFGDTSLVGGVVKANDPDASVSHAAFADATIAKDVIDWKKYTKDMAAQPELKRFANVTVDSAAQDGFTNAHNAPVRLTPSIPLSTIKRLSLYSELCGEILQIESAMSMEMAHGGGTQLSQDMTHWTALDSAGVFGGWGCTFYIPPFEEGGAGGPVFSTQMELGIKSTGGGSAGTGGYAITGYSTTRTTSRQYGQSFGALGFDPVVTIPGFIRYKQGPGASHNVAPAYKGIKNYYDVAAYAKTPTNQVDPANFAPALTIEVEKMGSQIRTAAQVLPGNNLLKLNDALKGNVMHAVSTSQSYFLRPEHPDHLKLLNGSYKRTDGKTEYASLYNPYWETRLVPTPQLLVDGSTAAQ